MNENLVNEKELESLKKKFYQVEQLQSENLGIIEMMVLIEYEK